MTDRRSKWLWSATIILWLASLFAGPALLSLPWVAVRMPDVFADPISGSLIITLYAASIGWFIALIFVGFRHTRRARWVCFAVPVALTVLTVFLATIGSNAGVDVSLVPN